MPEWICEIGASSWFYYKEICYDAARWHVRKIHLTITGKIPGFTFSAKSLHYGARQLAPVVMLLVCIRTINVSNFNMYPNHLTVVNLSFSADSRTIHSMKSWPLPFTSFSVHWLLLPCNSTLICNVRCGNMLWIFTVLCR